MPKYKKPLPWIPFWVDKWLFGSTRIELAADERSVWLDLLAIASKNDGYIRANEETPYLPSQLAGLLVIDVKLLNRTIEKCIQYHKIQKYKNGILRIANRDKYQLSPRQQRRYIQEDDEPKQEEKPSKPSRRFIKPTVEEIKKYCQERKNNVDPQQFWDFYESKGWYVGKNKMKDWKAAVRTWEKRHPAPPPKPTITFEKAKSMLDYSRTTSTMEKILEQINDKDKKELLQYIQKDNYLRALFQNVKKILKERSQS